MSILKNIAIYDMAWSPALEANDSRVNVSHQNLAMPCILGQCFHPDVPATRVPCGH